MGALGALGREVGRKGARVSMKPLPGNVNREAAWAARTHPDLLCDQGKPKLGQGSPGRPRAWYVAARQAVGRRDQGAATVAACSLCVCGMTWVGSGPIAARPDLA